MPQNTVKQLCPKRRQQRPLSCLRQPALSSKQTDEFSGTQAVVIMQKYEKLEKIGEGICCFLGLSREILLVP